MARVAFKLKQGSGSLFGFIESTSFCVPQIDYKSNRLQIQRVQIRNVVKTFHHVSFCLFVKFCFTGYFLHFSYII